MRSHLRFAFVAAVLASPVATGHRIAAEDVRNGTADVSAAVPQDVVLEVLKQYESPTADEAEAFAGALEAAMCTVDSAEWNGIIDWSIFTDLCFAGISLDAEARAEIERGIVKRLESSDGFIGRIRQALGEDGTYELVRVHEVDGQQRALFRMVSGEGLFNYHDFMLIRDVAGRTGVVDIYVYSIGELASTPIREMIGRLAAEQNRGFFDRLLGKPQDDLADKQLFRQMVRLNEQRKHAEALQTYAAAPQSVKLDKYVLIQRYIAAMNIEEASTSFPEIQATVDLYRREYPQDAALDFMSVGDHISREQYDLALQAVERIDRIIGGDAYLHEVRGDILYLADENDKAREQYELAIAALPHRDSAYFGVITIALDAQDHATTLAGLKRLHQAIELEWCDLSEVPAYADFVASEYHAQWLEYLRSKAAQP